MYTVDSRYLEVSRTREIFQDTHSSTQTKTGSLTEQGTQLLLSLVKLK